MPNLVLELKPGESIIVNGAGLRFRTRTRVELTSRARFLFGKQIMDPSEATTPARRLYHALQIAYVGADDQRSEALAAATAMIAALRAGSADPAWQDLLTAVAAACGEADGYVALRLAREMIRSEREAPLIQ